MFPPGEALVKRINKLLKNTPLLRSLPQEWQRYPRHRDVRHQYASFLEPSRALHPGVFEQPVIMDFFNNPIPASHTSPQEWGRYGNKENKVTD
jgi:hypothetical protein